MICVCQGMPSIPCSSEGLTHPTFPSLRCASNQYSGMTLCTVCTYSIRRVEFAVSPGYTLLQLLCMDGHMRLHASATCILTTADGMHRYLPG